MYRPRLLFWLGNRLKNSVARNHKKKMKNINECCCKNYKKTLGTEKVDKQRTAKNWYLSKAKSQYLGLHSNNPVLRKKTFCQGVLTSYINETFITKKTFYPHNQFSQNKPFSNVSKTLKALDILYPCTNFCLVTIYCWDTQTIQLKSCLFCPENTL